MRKQMKILCLVAVMSILLPIEAVQADPPFWGSGTTTIFPTFVEIKGAGGNLIITLSIVGVQTGTLSGTFTEPAILVFHPNGNSTFQGIRAFSGTVEGRTGTCLIRIQGTGSPAGFRGSFVIMGGTEGLAGLNGQGTFESTGPGTDVYSGRFHFDP